MAEHRTGNFALGTFERNQGPLRRTQDRGLVAGRERGRMPGAVAGKKRRGFRWCVSHRVLPLSNYPSPWRRRSLGDLERMIGGRHAGIDCHMQQRLANILPRGAGIGSGPHVHGHFVILPECGQKRDRHHRALALGPFRPRPDIAPGAFRNQLLKGLVEGRRVGAGAVHMGIAKHGAARTHAGLETL